MVDIDRCMKKILDGTTIVSGVSGFLLVILLSVEVMPSGTFIHRFRGQDNQGALVVPCIKTAMSASHERNLGRTSEVGGWVSPAPPFKAHC